MTSKYALTAKEYAQKRAERMHDRAKHKFYNALTGREPGPSTTLREAAALLRKAYEMGYPVEESTLIPDLSLIEYPLRKHYHRDLAIWHGVEGVIKALALSEENLEY